MSSFRSPRPEAVTRPARVAGVNAGYPLQLKVNKAVKKVNGWLSEPFEG
jgi:hypothetical protein